MNATQDQENSPSFYVSESTKRTVRFSFWPSGTALHVSVELAPADALRLAKQLTDSVDKLPRVAEASDLGIAA